MINLISIYYFDKNVLGDIVAIRDNSGYIVAAYEYDAWGNITYQEGAIADINPFRYRGYYYDNETGFYYLQTRYYDPTTMRFINADNYELIPQLSTVPGQLNMYAYANNNPIMYTDETGEGLFTLLFSFILGAVISATGSIVTQATLSGGIDWGKVGLSALFGGIGGAFAITGIGGVAGQFFIQGGLAVGQNVSEMAIYDTWDEFSIDNLILDFVISGSLGMIGAKGARADYIRFSQIEKSLISIVSRDYTRKGLKTAFNTLKRKSSKFIKDVICTTLKDSISSARISAIAKLFLV